MYVGGAYHPSAALIATPAGGAKTTHSVDYTIVLFYLNASAVDVFLHRAVLLPANITREKVFRVSF